MISGPAANDYEARDGQRSSKIGLHAHAQFKLRFVVSPQRFRCVKV